MKSNKPRNWLTTKAKNQVFDSGIAQVVKQHNAEVLSTYQHRFALLVDGTVMCLPCIFKTCHVVKCYTFCEFCGVCELDAVEEIDIRRRIPVIWWVKELSPDSVIL